MIASYKWIKDYINTNLTPEELLPYLISTGTGVEGYVKQGDGIENVVVGKIEKIEKHPDADKLIVCMVDVGKDEPIQIVTGASNVSEGDFVPIALVGSKLPSGMKIKKGKLRGVMSFGMMCSGEELNITEEDYKGAGVYGILVLNGEQTVGTDIKQVLGMDDALFEFETESNRPDCLSIIGIAREVAAACELDITMPAVKYTENKDEDISDYITASVENPEYCPRYLLKAVKNIRMGESPEWMKKRLRSAGVRPISNIVDITNFVMLEMGQPLHAFDANDIGGNKIIVRTARKGEKLITLDDKERELSTKNLLICDAKKPIGIAGIMGGQNSEIKEDTKTVIFECATFTYANARQSMRELGMMTESGMRYSRGVDAGNARNVIDRVLTLVELLDAGDIVSGDIDIINADLTPKVVKVDYNKINRLLGTKIKVDEMTKMMNRLFIPTTFDGDILKSTIPSFRSMDMSQGADIAEEVARMFGYDNIEESTMTGAVVRGEVPLIEKYTDRVKNALVNMGYFESITYSFMSDSELDKLGLEKDDSRRKMVEILNPLGEEYAFMRTTPIPDMLKVVSRNINMKQKDARLFETGRIYLTDEIPITKLPDEKNFVCLAVCGSKEDFYSLKGSIENIADILGIKKLNFEFGGEDYYHPGRKAKISIAGRTVGEIGEMHPNILKNYSIEQSVCVANICLDDLFSFVDDKRTYQQLPKYPAAERDLALIVDDEVAASKIEACIRKSGGKFLESVALFDVYKGDPLLPSQKSLAYSMLFRASDRTMTDEEVNEAIEKIMKATKDDLGAFIRQ
jgi:phenylalanyl-tRNA synthetase beta chain